MTVLTALLWRHAPTTENAHGILQGRTDTDPLGEGLVLGALSAQAIHSQYSVAQIYSSPLRRASATAEQLGLITGLPVVEDEGITQRSYGAWEGLTLEEIRASDPSQLAIRDAGGDPNVPGWEASAVVGQRVAAAVRRRMETALDAGVAAESALVFTSHGSAIATGLRVLLGLSADSHIFGHLAHTHWVELRVDYSAKAAGTWSVQRFNVGV